MADWNFILAPATVAVEIVLDEVAIISNSVKMLKADEFHQGLHEWISRTAKELTPEQGKTNHKVAVLIDHFVTETKAKTFPEFIVAIKDIPPARVIDFRLHWLRDHENYPGDDVLINDKQAYLDILQQTIAKKYPEKDKDFDAKYWSEEWESLQDIEQLIDEIVTHLQLLWDNYLELEWERVKPMLQEAVDAFNEIDYEGMSAYDAIETVAGRNMRGKDFFEKRLEKANKLIFMPNAHLGPFISWGTTDDERSMLFFFGARPPKNAKMKTSALSRSELLVRLNALADETRLKMLELLTENDELCAQDFITGLDLSQSSASRHLRQLTASGYVSERRRDVAKCYSLNPERIDDTILALKGFLKKS
ncbi:MAG: hypothetical protein Phog2KO_25160 [Phototrophicaceae bacterium]